MSSYRSYVPWKSNLSGTYKSGTSSTYSSRDNISTSDGTTPRFGSIATPAAYRPSYSGGTYRSVKRDNITTPTTFVNRFGSTGCISKDDKDKSSDSLNKIQSNQQQKYAGNSTNKENSCKMSRFSTSTSSLTKYGGRKSRDPSPAPIERRTSNLTISRVKSREPSPAVNSLRGRSRDPSPSDTLLKNKLSSASSPSSSYSSYRLGSRIGSGLGSRLGSSSSSNTNPLPRTTDTALSYMSCSDFRARSVQRSKENKETKANHVHSTSESSSGKDFSDADKTTSESDKIKESREPEILIPVTVITRGTSPTPPGATSFSRTRRIEIAKTIEKTIQRSTNRPKCLDKEIQSDRLDDTTRYSRFSGAVRAPSGIPWSTTNGENKFGASSMKYSSSPNTSSKTSNSDQSVSSKNEPEVSEESKKELSTPSNSKTISSSSSKSAKSEKSKNSTDSKSKIKQQIPTSTKQSLSGTPPARSLPPVIPKSESPVKSVSTSSGSSKWPNKDFRKSALNIGPTDRPRKSRTPSTGTDTEDKPEMINKSVNNSSNTTNQLTNRMERSPSVGSETSNVSVTASTSSSSTENESKGRHQRKIKTLSSSSSPSSSKHQAMKTYFDVDESSSLAASGYNKNICVNSGHNYNAQDKIPVDIHDKHQPTNQPPCKVNRNLSKRNSPVDSSPTVAKNDEAKSFLIRKLGSVSNFFITRAQDSSNSGETFYLDNSSSNSISDGLKQDVTIATTNPTSASVSQLNPIATSTITTPTNISNTKTETGSDLDDSSWWLDTSQQIDTESALDVKDDMKYRLRHIDSGELAWWMRNDNDEDTIADNLNSFNENDHDKSENTEKVYYNNNKIDRLDYGEKSWWSNENDENNSKNKKYKINRCESGERLWWLQNDEGNKENVEQQQQESEVIEKSWWPRGNVSKDSNKSNNVSQQNSTKSNEPLWMKKEKSSGSNETSCWGRSPEDSVDHENQKEPAPPQNNSNSVSNIESSPAKDRFWWMNSPTKKLTNIRPIQSGERAWWLQDDPLENNENKQQQQQKQKQNESESESSDDEEVENVYSNENNRRNLERPPPLGDRASPEGLEDPSKGRKSPYSNIPYQRKNKNSNKQNFFISRHTNIDELLGGSCRPLSPLMDRFAGKNMFLEEVTPAQVRIHDSTAKMPYIQRMERDEWDFSSTQPASKIPAPDRHYDRAKSELDDAALQVYKDGDYGAYLDLESSLAEQAEEIEGLNSSRKNSLVVRTQLSVRVHAIIEKLLSSEGSELRRALFSLKQIFQEDKDLVHGFVALGGLNCLVRVGNGADQNYQNYILRALGQVMLYVDGMNGVMKHGPTIQWLYSLIASKYRLVVKTALKLLLVFVEYVESNCYLLVNAVHNVDNAQGTLPWSNIMKLLKDYDNADTELLIYATSLINKTLAGLSDQDSFYDESDFLEQQGMEAVIQRYMSRPGTDLDLLDQLQLYEAVLKFEDGETDGIRLPDNSVRKTLRYRSSTDSKERRKSRRHSTGTSPSMIQNTVLKNRCTPPSHGTLDEDSSSSTNSNEFNGGVFRECKGQREGAGVTPGLRRRRERAERQKTFMKEQEAAANGLRSHFEKKDEFNGLESENDEKRLLLQIKRDHTVKDITQKLSNLPSSPQEEKPQNGRIGDMTGLISKAKEGLAKSKSKGDISRSPSVDQEIKKPEPKKSENELHWEELVRNLSRPLTLCDLDFTDLNSEDEKDVLAPRGLGGAVPPPPPPIGIPPPLGMGMGPPPPCGIFPPPLNMPPPPTNLVPPPAFNHNTLNKPNNTDYTNSIKKNKKTVKLFWKEVREDMIPATIGKTIWDELPKAIVDTQKLEHLFESRAKDLMTKEKQQEMNKNKEIIVLDHKRSNAINIAMTKLPPPRAIKAAILKMDATVVTREGIDKLLNMLPTEEERGKIQEAQMSNPELPLGSAEQFLLTLSSISELAARLKLWAFKLDFENSEREIAEPLMDLKQGLELLKTNKTFKCILSTLLSVGIFLNGAPVKGFQIEYLAKVPEVKDTVHKHSLLHHLCHMVMETAPDTTDLYSEIGPITRASKADFTELAHNLVQLETECKASWDRLKLIAKHDCPNQLKQKLVDFLADCAERIITLQIIHRRVINRYRKFLLWLGVPQHHVAESRPNEFCRIVSEFALEYRTTRERVQQQIEKKANHRERNKTRGKMIIDVGKFRSQEDRADAELKQLLGSPNPSNENPDGTLTWRRRRAENLRSPIIKQNEENFTDGDDEILESLVKTATKAPGHRPTPRERKRTRHADRKSLKRSRTREGFTVGRTTASPEH